MAWYLCHLNTFGYIKVSDYYDNNNEPLRWLKVLLKSIYGTQNIAVMYRYKGDPESQQKRNFSWQRSVGTVHCLPDIVDPETFVLKHVDPI